MHDNEGTEEETTIETVWYRQNDKIYRNACQSGSEKWKVSAEKCNCNIKRNSSYTSIAHTSLLHVVFSKLAQVRFEIKNAALLE